jgi:hypothetical protein
MVKSVICISQEVSKVPIQIGARVGVSSKIFFMQHIDYLLYGKKRGGKVQKFKKPKQNTLLEFQRDKMFKARLSCPLPCESC